MTLDLVVWAPEAFLSFCLLVLLWYGSGSLVSPVAERICVLNNTSSSGGAARGAPAEPLAPLGLQALT